MRRGILVKRGVCLLERARRNRAGRNGLRERIIGFVRGRSRVVDEIAIDVGILFVDAPVPGKAERVQRMQEHQFRAFGHAFREPHPQQPRLHAGAEITFDAVRSGDQQKRALGAAGACGRHIHEERLAVGCIGMGVDAGGDTETIRFGGCDEGLAGLAVIGWKMLFGIGCHGGVEIVLSPLTLQRGGQ